MEEAEIGFPFSDISGASYIFLRRFVGHIFLPQDHESVKFCKKFRCRLKLFFTRNKYIRDMRLKSGKNQEKFKKHKEAELQK